MKKKGLLDMAVGAFWETGRIGMSLAAGLLVGEMTTGAIKSIAPNSKVIGVAANVSGAAASGIVTSMVHSKVPSYAESETAEGIAALNSLMGKKDDDAGYTTEETSDATFTADFTEV